MTSKCAGARYSAKSASLIGISPTKDPVQVVDRALQAAACPQLPFSHVSGLLHSLCWRAAEFRPLVLDYELLLVRLPVRHLGHIFATTDI